MNLLDESGHQKLVDLLTNDLALRLIEAVQSLLHWFGTGLDLQGVLGDFPRYAWHIRGTPCKHVSVCAEKVCWHFLASLLKIDYKSIISNGTRNVGCWYTITIVTSER